MKKIVLVGLSGIFILISCTGQKKMDKDLAQLDTIKPKTNYSVHKEYDENGNLISVDSTYSYFYSNIKGDSVRENEIFNQFKMDFGDNFRSMDSLFMNDFYSGMPLNLNDFYTDDFFQQHFEMNHGNIEKIFKQMDSLKNSFYIEQRKQLEKTPKKQL